MTQGNDQKGVALREDPEEVLREKAQELLNVPEQNMLMAYVRAGKHPLAPDTIAALFQLYLNGSNCGEIHRLNKGLPYEAILWARVKFEWDRKRDEYVEELTEKIRDKVMQSQLQTTELMADLLTATSRKHGDKIKKYIQTGDEADLGDALSINRLNDLLRIAEGLQKITGQDRVHKVETKNTQRLEIGVGGATQSEEISTEAAAGILAILAEEKRKKRGEQA
jgi:hypothetical protein